jgi:hypothetical protein
MSLKSGFVPDLEKLSQPMGNLPNRTCVGTLWKPLILAKIKGFHKVPTQVRLGRLPIGCDNFSKSGTNPDLRDILEECVDISCV